MKSDPLSYALGPYRFREAQSAGEREAIYRLNYRIFVEEIPQHTSSDSGRLIDKFDHKNQYFVALRNGEVVGMLAAHDRPPFSAVAKMASPELLDSYGDSFLEVRLLAVERGHRSGAAFGGLLYLIFRHAASRGYHHILISGVAERVRLYERLGFRPLGPPVLEGKARFVPMILPMDDPPPLIARGVARWSRRIREN